MNITKSVGVCGMFKAEILKGGEVKYDSGFQSNMVLDNYFKNLNGISGTNSLADLNLFVGTGTAQPTGADNSLQAQVSGGYARQSTTVTNVDDATDPNYTLFNMTRVFNSVEGQYTGNLAEFALHFGTASSVGCVIRSLFKDSQGLPTVITVAADETLRLTHVLTYKEPRAPAITTGVMIGGEAYTVSLFRNDKTYSETYGTTNFWTEGKYRQVAGTSLSAPLSNGKVINGSVSAGTKGQAVFSGGSAISGIATSSVKVGIINSNFFEGHIDVSLLASDLGVSNNLLAIGIFNGGNNGFDYACYFLTFSPYLKKNSNNKLTFRVTIKYSRA